MTAQMQAQVTTSINPNFSGDFFLSDVVSYTITVVKNYATEDELKLKEGDVFTTMFNIGKESSYTIVSANPSQGSFDLDNSYSYQWSVENFSVGQTITCAIMVKLLAIGFG